ncbi:hypothetical protein [Chromobacterium amazonense]|uniref:hypothetical protein n=1 Tax=Chromobacterium amazonense TaxID=1382803 RepID=UPI0014717CBC|nr:hypothetical protein [Chromobacterium amazonense]MDE1712242.1 hypothetical protein [Chromobacterium amazonense]
MIINAAMIYRPKRELGRPLIQDIIINETRSGNRWLSRRRRNQPSRNTDATPAAG